jgi:MFS family permease
MSDTAVSNNAKSLLLLTAVNSVWGVVMGLIGPFYILYIKDVAGGMDQLGIAYATMIFTQAIASYSMGKFSDRHGRKRFMIVSAYADAVILFLFTLITSPAQLFVLQAGLGITNAVAGTTRQALLGDLTAKTNRGLEIGRFNAIVGVFSAVGIAGGGVFAKFYGIKPIFSLAAVSVALSTTLLFFVRETESDPDSVPERKGKADF